MQSAARQPRIVSTRGRLFCAWKRFGPRLRLEKAPLQAGKRRHSLAGDAPCRRLGLPALRRIRGASVRGTQSRPSTGIGFGPPAARPGNPSATPHPVGRGDLPGRVEPEGCGKPACRATRRPGKRVLAPRRSPARERLEHLQASSADPENSSPLAPAATTVTGVWASSLRSAEMSKLSSAPRCTPPIPPVAKTAIPARCATIIVAATVVAPVSPLARHTARSAGG